MSKEKQQDNETFYDIISEIINCYHNQCRILRELEQIERYLSHRIQFDKASSLNKGKLIVVNYNCQYKYRICIPYNYPFEPATIKILKPNIDQMKSHPNLNSKTGCICIGSENSVAIPIVTTISTIDSMNLQLKNTQEIQDIDSNGNYNKVKKKYFESFVVNKRTRLQQHKDQLCRDDKVVMGYCSLNSQKIDIPFIIKNIILCLYSKYGRFAIQKRLL